MFQTICKKKLRVKKTLLLTLKKCIFWVKVKLIKSGLNYKITKEDLEDIEMAYEFQKSDVNHRSHY